eukprot:TRINITY_DN2487_c0_g1_i1.p2 TRINITY_DN2487_c0_g1~~TRINITY_DN2487_c0_g1_i1.p2  ORF type:complete len:171 (-),score=9.78 TRINITY_DN2487_c0_g1_i1:685-1197(-)
MRDSLLNCMLSQDMRANAWLSCCQSSSLFLTLDSPEAQNVKLPFRKPALLCVFQPEAKRQEDAVVRQVGKNFRFPALKAAVAATLVFERRKKLFSIVLAARQLVPQLEHEACEVRFALHRQARLAAKGSPEANFQRRRREQEKSSDFSRGGKVGNAVRAQCESRSHRVQL